MDKYFEQRSHKRIYKNFIARFRIIPEESQKENSSKWEVVTLNDVSAGGAVFNYDKEIKIGSFLDITITCLWLEQPLKCRARVLRVEKIENRPLYRIAVIFVEIDDNDKSIINGFAEKFYRREDGSVK